MGCEGPSWYDPAAEIAKKIETELPEDFHCNNERSPEWDGDGWDNYEAMNDLTPEEEAALYEASLAAQAARSAAEKEAAAAAANESGKFNW